MQQMLRIWMRCLGVPVLMQRRHSMRTTGVEEALKTKAATAKMKTEMKTTKSAVRCKQRCVGVG